MLDIIFTLIFLIILWPLVLYGWGIVILKETILIRTEMLHHRLKVITRNQRFQTMYHVRAMPPKHNRADRPPHCRGQTFRPVWVHALNADVIVLFESLYEWSSGHLCLNSEPSFSKSVILVQNQGQPGLLSHRGYKNINCWFLSSSKAALKPLGYVIMLCFSLICHPSIFRFTSAHVLLNSWERGLRLWGRRCYEVLAIVFLSTFWCNKM